MAVKKIIQIGDPRLKAKNQAIKDFKDVKIKKIIKDLVDTMHKGGLIGIAAPQIGYNYKIFATHPRETKWRPKNQADDLRIYINPRITYGSKNESIIYEGCGCVLNCHLMGPVKRPAIIKIQAYDKDSSKFELKCDGILSRVIQHEYDHMFGVEFTERICDYTKLMYDEFYIKFIKNSKKQKKASKINVIDFKKL